MTRDRLTHEEFRRIEYFGALDGLRAVAASVVILFHFSGANPLFDSGWLGVHMFFVVSGFLITSLLLRERDRFGRIGLKRFWIRRVFRIVPMYFVALFLSVLIMKESDTWEALEGPRVIWYFLTFNAEYSPSLLNFGQAWTLGVEEKFYIVWPVVIAVAAVFRRGYIVGLIAAASTMAVLTSHSSQYVHYVVLLMGAALALALHHPRSFRFLQGWTTPMTTLIFMAAAFAVQFAEPNLTSRYASEVPAILLFGAAVTLCIPGILGPSALRQLLSHRLAAWIGERSYSLYLLQFVAGHVVLRLYPEFLPGTIRALVVLVVGLLLADMAFRYIERPLTVIGRRIAQRGRQPEPHHDAGVLASVTQTA